MNFTTTTNNLNNFININVKPMNFSTDNDTSLHLNKKIRQIRDCTTDSFIGTFFKHAILPDNPDDNIINDKARHIFLLYVYDIFKYNIMAYFNEYLLEQGLEVLNVESEYADFIFKGGNIMFIYVLQIINKNSEFAELIKKNNILREYINESFGVSDFDFTIYLKTNTHKKFVSVQNHLIKFIIKNLERINNFFNLYLSDVLLSNNSLFNNKYENNNLESTINPSNKPDELDLNPPISIDLNNIFNSEVNEIEKNTLEELDYINLLFAELNNSHIFDKLMSRIVKREPSNFFINNLMLTGDLISVNFVEKYNKNILSLNSDKVSFLIISLISKIIEINQILLNLETTVEIINLRNKLIFSNIINTFNQLIFINSKYNFKVFNIGPKFLNYYNLSIELFNQYFNNIETVIKDIKFYNPNKIHQFIKNLAEKLYDKSKPIDKNASVGGTIIRKPADIFVKEPNNESKFLFVRPDTYLDESNFKIIKITNDDATNINTTNLIIRGTDNVIVQDDIRSSLNIINSKQFDNFHYISYNSSINTTRNNNLSIVNFDLIRTKLNLLYSDALVKNIGEANYESEKIIKIPGEFIDISISSMDDTFARHYNSDPLQNKLNYKLSFNDKEFVIESYNPKYMVYDLEGVLYTQNSFTPWVDGKYEKRIKRLLFIFGVSSSKNYEYLRIINLITSQMINFIKENIQVQPDGSIIENQQNDNVYMKMLRQQFFSTDINLRNNFVNICEEIQNNHGFLLDFKFGNYQYYYYGLDNLINSVFYSFLVYISFDHDLTKNNPVNERLRNINNHLREEFNYQDYLTIQEYKTNYIDKIKDYINAVKNISENLIAFLNGVIV
jgi:hypothetical protein